MKSKTLPAIFHLRGFTRLDGILSFKMPDRIEGTGNNIDGTDQEKCHRRLGRYKYQR